MLVGYVLKYVAPLYLGVVFAVFLYQSFTAKEGNYLQTLMSDPYAQLTVGFIALVGALFTLFIAQSIKRWNRLEAGQEVTP
jgi:membrane protein YdbS with pleckstrin-like domain